MVAIIIGTVILIAVLWYTILQDARKGRPEPRPTSTAPVPVDDSQNVPPAPVRPSGGLPPPSVNDIIPDVVTNWQREVDPGASKVQKP